MAATTVKSEKGTLVKTLETAEDAAGGGRARVGEIVESIDARGFGPLLMLPAIVTILPTGAIPGVPDVCAALMALVAVQILAGRRKPWLPERLKRLGVPSAKLSRAFDKAKPWLGKIDKITRRRWPALTGGAAQRAIALVILVICGLTVAIGMIPYVPALLMLPVLFFAVGLTARDGLAVVIGLGVLAGAALLILQLL